MKKWKRRVSMWMIYMLVITGLSCSEPQEESSALQEVSSKIEMEQSSPEKVESSEEEIVEESSVWEYSPRSWEMPGEVALTNVSGGTLGTTCRYNDIYYYIMKEGDYMFIMYYELASGQRGKLCGRPECSHDNQKCNAYIYKGSNLQVYDDQLYVMDGRTLYCMELNGENREMVMAMPIAASMFWITVGDDYVGCCELQENVAGGRGGYIGKVIRYKKGDSKSGEELVSVSSDQAARSRFFRQGDYLYYYFDTGAGDQFRNTLYEINIQTGEAEKLLDEVSDWMTQIVFLAEDGVYLGQLAGSNSAKVVRFDFESGELVEEAFVETETPQKMTANKDYIFVIDDYSREGVVEYKIYNYENVLITEGKYEYDTDYLSPVCEGYDKDGFLVKFMDGEGFASHSHMYLIPYDGSEVIEIGDDCYM